MAEGNHVSLKYEYRRGSRTAYNVYFVRDHARVISIKPQLQVSWSFDLYHLSKQRFNLQRKWTLAFNLKIKTISQAFCTYIFVVNISGNLFL